MLDASRIRNIYVAEDQHLKGNLWVVKQLQPVGVELDRSALTTAFEKEARLIATLEHPNVPRLIDFFVQDSLLYIVREYVPGTDLHALQAQRGEPLPEKDVLKIGVQLTSLMNYLLRKKLSPVVFRELSLQNLVLTREGQVKLVDFGFSHLFSRETRLGPPDYSAPEQFSEEGTIDARTLVYNVGALAYHLLTGHNPGTSPFELPRPSDLNPALSGAACAVVEKATQNDRRKRHKDLNELCKGLENALLQKMAPKRQRLPRPSPPPEPATPTIPLPPTSGTGTQRVSLVPKKKSNDSAALTWLVGILLTILMGGGLIAIYHFLLRPESSG
ncbi:MAG: serine/threonine protein kinase [Armatimonadetes bacterium]|nr:serine/threonine protein kinase [Armatimonadota bacterium]